MTLHCKAAGAHSTSSPSHHQTRLGIESSLQIFPSRADTWPADQDPEGSFNRVGDFCTPTPSVGIPRNHYLVLFQFP